MKKILYKTNAQNTVLVHHKVLLWLLIGLLALGQLQRIQLTTTVAGYMHEIILAAMLAIFLIENRTNRSNLFSMFSHVAHSPLIWFIGWIGIWTSINAILQADIVPLLYLGRLGLLAMSAVSIHLTFQSNRTYLHYSLLALGCIWAVLGVLQYLFIPDTRFLLILGWDEHYYRLIGTVFDPAYMGILMVLVSIFLFSVLSKKPTLQKTMLVCLFSAVCALTYSRASYGALAIAYLGVLIVQRKTAVFPVLVSAVIAVVIVFVAPKPGGEGVILTRTASITARTGQAQQLLQNLQPMQVLWGEGLFSKLTIEESKQATVLGIPQHARVPDNILLLLFRGTGLVGCTFLLYGIWKQFHQLVESLPYLTIALASTIWHSQFNNTLLQPFVLLFLLLGFMPTLEKFTNGK